MSQLRSKSCNVFAFDWIDVWNWPCPSFVCGLLCFFRSKGGWLSATRTEQETVVSIIGLIFLVTLSYFILNWILVDVMCVRKKNSGFLLAFVLLMGFIFISSFFYQFLYFTFILCCLIPIFLSAFLFYLTLIVMTLYAQAYSDGVKELPS